MSKPEISKKINNTEYAPGTATYGLSGKDGIRGDNGNCIYYTSFNIVSGEDLPSFKYAVREQLLPITNGAHVTRAYQNGDYFFDKFGNILELWNIDDLKNHPNLGNNYLRYFKKVGKIKSADTAENIFSSIENSSRLSLNPQFSGLDINSAESELIDVSSENYPLRIISNNLNGDNIELLQATAFHNYDKMPDLKIYYDTVRNVWHLDSDIPVVIDSEMTINKEKNENVDLDDYSPVIINDTPITVFYNYCRQIMWSINGATGLQLINFPEFPKDILNQLKVKVLLDIDGMQLTLFISATDPNWDTNMCYTGSFKSLNIKQVSLIYNIEVFIDKFIVPAIYLDKSFNIRDKAIVEELKLKNTLVKTEFIPTGVKAQKFQRKS